MKTWLALLAVFAVVCSALHAQVMPAGTGVGTNFSYVLRYSQTAHFGGSLGDWGTAAPSGEVDYRNGRRRTPFFLIYAGGYTWTLTGPTQYSTGFFQRLSLHQVLSGDNWKASLGDDVSYRPQAPFTGFSGIPGTGEPIGAPSPPPNQSILTLGTHALDNLATGELSRIINPKSSVSVGAKYDLLLFPDSEGLDTNYLLAHSEYSRSITSRSSVFGEYIFNRFSYDVNLTTDAHVVMAGAEHAFTRRFHVNLSAGPGWVTSSRSTVIPASTIVNANAGLDYQLRGGSAFVRYDRSTSGGSGYLLGQLSDIVDGGYTREFSRTFTAEVIGGYRRIQPLDKKAAIQLGLGAVQGSWRLGSSGHLSGFANYTVVVQSSAAPLPPNAINGPLHSISFGLAYMMRARRNY